MSRRHVCSEGGEGGGGGGEGVRGGGGGRGGRRGWVRAVSHVPLPTSHVPRPVSRGNPTTSAVAPRLFRPLHLTSVTSHFSSLVKWQPQSARITAMRVNSCTSAMHVAYALSICSSFVLTQISVEIAFDKFQFILFIM